MNDLKKILNFLLEILSSSISECER